MKMTVNPFFIMAGLHLLLVFMLFMNKASGTSESFGNRPAWLDASDHDLWPGGAPSNRRDGHPIVELEDDYFDNSDPYVMDGSEDIPVHRPFVPYDPLTMVPGIIRRPVSFDRSKLRPDVGPPSDQSATGSNRRPHVAGPDDDTSWRWPSDTLKPEQSHTTRPTPTIPEKSVTHAQVFMRPEDVPSIRLHGEIMPASHHAESPNQPGEVNYLNKQLGESSEDRIQNHHLLPQSHESTQVQVVESGGMQPAERPASDEEVYGLSGELSTLDHVAKTTPMQNGIVREGGNGGDSLEQPTTTLITEKHTTTSSKSSVATLPVISNVHVLSSVGMIIQQSTGQRTMTTSSTTHSLHDKTPNTNEFSSISATEEKQTSTTRQPVYHTSGLSEVTRYIPTRVSTGTIHAIDPTYGHQTENPDLTKHEDEISETQAMTVVTRKSIKVSTSDNTPASHEIMDDVEDIGTTSGILGIRVKFTMSGEDERFSSADDSEESDITTANDNTPTVSIISSTPLPTTMAQPTTDLNEFTTTPTTSTVTNSITTNIVTNFNLKANTATNVTSTNKATNSNPTTHTVTHSTTTIINATPSTTTTTRSSTTREITNPSLTTNSAKNMNVTSRVTYSRATTRRQGKSIGISVGNGLITSRIPYQNATRLGFKAPTTEITPMVNSDTPTTPTTTQTVVSNEKVQSSNVHLLPDSSSENAVFTATTQKDTELLQDPNIHNITKQFNLPVTSINLPATTATDAITTTTPSSPTPISQTILASSRVTHNPVYIQKVTNTTKSATSITSKATSPELKPESTTTVTPTQTELTTKTTTITTRHSKISTFANRPFVLPTAPSVLDDPNIRKKLTPQSDSSDQMDSNEQDNLFLPTAPSVITNPPVERATIRRRLQRPQLTRTTPGSQWRPTMRSRTNTVTHPAVTPYPTRSTTSPQPDLQETMAPPVVHLDDNHVDNRQLDSPDIHKFFEEQQEEDTVFITPATTNTIIISSVIGGCAILFFFVMMIFCMCKQKKLRRARYRQPPQEYANVFVGKYS